MKSTSTKRFQGSDGDAVTALVSQPLSRPWPPSAQTFLPVSWTWLARACRLPGRAVHVALALAAEARAWPAGEPIPLPHPRLRTMGVNRFAALRGLRCLEEDGLARVRRDVVPMLVTIVEVETIRREDPSAAHLLPKSRTADLRTEPDVRTPTPSPRRRHQVLHAVPMLNLDQEEARREVPVERVDRIDLAGFDFE